KCGGTLGEAGCVAWMFQKKGVLTLAPADVEEDHVLEVALEAGAEDLRRSGDVWEILTDPTDLHSVRQALDGKLESESAEHQYLAANEVEVDGSDAEKLARLIEMLEDLDDVLNVHTNASFADA